VKKPPTTETSMKTVCNEYSFTGRENSVTQSQKMSETYDAFDNVMMWSKLRQSDVVTTAQSLLANAKRPLTEHNTTSLT